MICLVSFYSECRLRTKTDRSRCANDRMEIEDLSLEESVESVE